MPFSSMVDGQEVTPPPLTPEQRAQARLKKICEDDGIDKVHHIGIFIRGKADANPTPYYFFTKSSSQFVNHRSGVRFSMSERRLYVEVTSPSEEAFQLRRTDGGVIILEVNQPEDVYRGDRVEVGSITSSSKFRLANTFLTHRAPPKHPAPHNTSVATSGTKSTKKAYPTHPTTRFKQEMRAAKKAVKTVNKAKAQLRSGKKMTTGQRNKAIAEIDKAYVKQCPFEKHFTLCKVNGCPFHHQNKESPCKKDFKGGEEVSEATVAKWFPDH